MSYKKYSEDSYVRNIQKNISAFELLTYECWCGNWWNCGYCNDEYDYCPSGTCLCCSNLEYVTQIISEDLFGVGVIFPKEKLFKILQNPGLKKKYSLLKQ